MAGVDIDGKDSPEISLDSALRPSLLPLPQSERAEVFFEEGDDICGRFERRLRLRLNGQHHGSAGCRLDIEEDLQGAEVVGGKFPEDGGCVAVSPETSSESADRDLDSLRSDLVDNAADLRCPVRPLRASPGWLVDGLLDSSRMKIAEGIGVYGEEDQAGLLQVISKFQSRLPGREILSRADSQSQLEAAGAGSEDALANWNGVFFQGAIDRLHVFARMDIRAVAELERVLFSTGIGHGVRRGIQPFVLSVIESEFAGSLILPRSDSGASGALYFLSAPFE